MPPEAAAPIEGAAAPAVESGSDTGQWFERAGLNPNDTDPETVAEALKFRGEWEGKQPLDEQAVHTRAQELRAKDWENPDYYKRVEDFFREQLKRQEVLNIDDKAEVTPQLLRTLADNFRKEIDDRLKVAMGGLGGVAEKQRKQEESVRVEQWAKGFEGQVADAAKRANPGFLDNGWLTQQLRLHFIGGSIKDDKPATLRAAAKAIVQQEATRMQRFLDNSGVSKLISKHQPALSPETPLDDAISDPDKRQALVQQIMRHGM